MGASIISRETLIKIPKPDFIVLYNGNTPFPDEATMRLSDSYKEPPEGLAELGGFLELTVRVLNINMGRNEALVKKCDELYGYTLLIGKIKANTKNGLKLADAIKRRYTTALKRVFYQSF